MKDIIKGEKVDIFRRIFAVCGSYIFNDNIRDFLKLLLVVPKLFKELDEVLRVFVAFCFLYRIVSVIPALAAEVDRCKAVDGHIGTFIHRQKAHHLFLRHVRLKCHLPSDPIGAFFCDRLLRQFVSELDFKFRAVQAALSRNARNIKLALRLRCFFCEKGWRGEDKSQLIYAFQLLFKLLIGINRKAGSRDRQLAAPMDACL